MCALLQAVNSELTKTTLSPSISFASMSSEEFDRTHVRPVLTDAETLSRRLQGGRGIVVLTRMQKNWTCVEVALGAVESTEFTKLRRVLVGAPRLGATRSHICEEIAQATPAGSGMDVDARPPLSKKHKIGVSRKGSGIRKPPRMMKRTLKEMVKKRLEKISKFTTRKPSARFSWSPRESPTTTAGTESSGRDPRIRG
jgi:hypothetical protein